jgi:periplasmic protein TonB
MVYLQTSRYPTFHNGQRRAFGIGLIVLLHGGLLLALMKGLDIRDFTSPPPPLIAHVIETPPVKPTVVPTTIEFNPTVSTSVIPVDVPTVNVEETTDTWTTDVKEQSGPVVATRAEPVITRARVDPKHPLTQPSYPPQSRRMGENGSVELLLYVLPNGRVGEARITRSSGFPRLDEAAVREAKRSWRLLPNEENGAAVAGWNSIVITFKLVN